MTTIRIAISWLLLLLVARNWAAAAAAAAGVEEQKQAQACGPDEEESCDATKVLGTGNANDAESSGCVDGEKRCDYWASVGECEANPSYMHMSCPKSCQICDEQKV
jgi:hypothetical protein